MTVTLPFPPPALSPNARSHWAKKYRAFKAYKTECVAMLLSYKKHLAGRDTFALTFCPPDRHRRDLDNMLASAKALLDALSVVCGVDDSRFSLTIAKGEPVPGGAVVIHV